MHCFLQWETITIDKVRSEDFGVYTCTAKNRIDGGSTTRTFDIELTEKGKVNHKLICYLLLPTTYEVWGKVLFSQGSVILFTGEGRGGGLHGGADLPPPR